ncbi:MAG: LysR family transcriptional regulator [Devosia sp.]
MKLDLNLLLTFEAMDKTRSVSSAAAMLGLSQPATSAALGRLRRALSDELFTYAGGTMQPTPKARRLAPAVLTALSELRAVLDGERPFDPLRATDRFTIGVTDYVSAVMIPSLAAVCAREAPGLDLRLASYTKAEAGALVENGTFDMAIGVFPEPPERAVVTPLMQESFVGVAKVGHAVGSKPLDAERFASFDHALFTLERDARGVVDDALASIGLSRRVRLALPHLLALPEILRRTELIATVPRRAADMFASDIASFELPFLNLEPWTLHMLFSPFSRSDRAHAWLRGKIVSLCAGL